MSEERQLIIEVEYDATMVPERTRKAIDEVFRRAARDVQAKVALLSNPAVVASRAQVFEDGRYTDICLDQTDAGQ